MNTRVESPPWNSVIEASRAALSVLCVVRKFFIGVVVILAVAGPVINTTDFGIIFFLIAPSFELPVRKQILQTESQFHVILSSISSVIQIILLAKLYLLLKLISANWLGSDKNKGGLAGHITSSSGNFPATKLQHASCQANQGLYQKKAMAKINKFEFLFSSHATFEKESSRTSEGILDSI